MDQAVLQDFHTFGQALNVALADQRCFRALGVGLSPLCSIVVLFRTS